MSHVDVVVVSFNSRRSLRECVEPLARLDRVRVIVVDNASTDGSLEVLAGLPVTALRLDRNGGFAVGCNRGWGAGEAPLVLFLNPDARIDEPSLRRLVQALEADPAVGAAAPKILDAEGFLDFSQRRFPRLRSTYAAAFFLHRLFPRAQWVDEVVRDREAYARGRSPDWVSGACILVRRSLLEELEGLDEGFFMYCEDKDLCWRLRRAGYEVRYEPEAVCLHEGGVSGSRSSLLPVLAASRLRFARKHCGRTVAALERIGIGIYALLRVLVSRGGFEARAGHARALRVAVWGR